MDFCEHVRVFRNILRPVDIENVTKRTISSNTYQVKKNHSKFYCYRNEMREKSSLKRRLIRLLRIRNQYKNVNISKYKN